jgi:putative ABC transport system permease protein
MLRNYLRIALRNFTKNRVFSFINVFGLTLGIACSLAIFMIVRHEWSYDTFHPQHQRIYRVVCDFRYPEGMEYQSGVPRPLPEAFRHDFPQSQVTTIFGSPNSQISLPDDQAGDSRTTGSNAMGSKTAGVQTTGNTRRFREETGIFYAEPAFFDIFSFKWLSGNPAEVLSRPGTIALTRETAEKYFGSWQNAIGKTLLKDNKDLLTVQGILENPPTNTDFPLKASSPSPPCSAISGEKAGEASAASTSATSNFRMTAWPRRSAASYPASAPNMTIIK